MITWFDILVFLSSAIFAWVNCFLLHELMHIKSQGLAMEGMIEVGKIGFTAGPRKMVNENLFFLAGGLYSGLIYLYISLLLFLCGALWFTITFSTVGMINVVYGIHERKYHGEGRFKVYLLTGLGMLLLWSSYVYMYVL